MKQQLELIQRNKNKETNRLMKVKNNIIIAFYDMVIHNHRDLHRRIKTLTLQNKFLYKPSLIVGKQIERDIKKQKANDEPDVLAMLFLKILQERKINQKLSKKVYDYTRELEGKWKKDFLKDMVKHAERHADPYIFFLASEHSDCAKDHLDYQGKIYITSGWKNYIDNKERIAEVEEYIQKNNIKTYEWVIFEPVWLVTRPNCRHYFRQCKISEVLGKHPKDLITKYKMSHETGLRSMRQTIKHDMTRKTYTISEVETLIKKYSERLELHEGLGRVKMTPDLKNLIHKDRLLIRKWKQVLKKLNK